MAGPTPKTILVLASLSGSNLISRFLGLNGNHTATGVATAASQAGPQLSARSRDCFHVALRCLAAPGDTVILLVVQPPPNARGAPAPQRPGDDLLRQLEYAMLHSLTQALHTEIDGARAQRKTVGVVVCLQADRLRTVLSNAWTTAASFVVLPGPRRALPDMSSSRRGPLALTLGSAIALGITGITNATAEFSDVSPEALARGLPWTCCVAIVGNSGAVQVLQGEQAPPTVPMVDILRSTYGEAEFSIGEILEATGNLSESNRIGDGGSASVYRGSLRGWPVAVKRLRPWGSELRGGAGGEGGPPGPSFRDFVNELRVMRSTSHQNLLRLYGVCVGPTTELGPTELFLILEFQQNGALDRRLRSRTEPVLLWEQRLRIAAGAAAGLRHLHSCSPPIIHRDVKTANMLLDIQLHAKVADFGLAKFAPDARASLPFTVTAVLGTLGYLAPEYWQTGAITKNIDVYAFGVVLLELVSGHPAYNPDNTPQHLTDFALYCMGTNDFARLLDPRLRGSPNLPLILEQLEHVVLLAMLCLAREPADRPEMSEVEQHLLSILSGPIRRSTASVVHTPLVDPVY